MDNNALIKDRDSVSIPSAPASGNAALGSLDKDKEKESSITVSEVELAGPDTKHDIDQDLKKIGVEKNHDKPNLTKEHFQLGVKHVGSDTSFPVVPSEEIKYPMSEEEIAAKEVGESDDSTTWLKALMKKIIDKEEGNFH